MEASELFNYINDIAKQERYLGDEKNIKYSSLLAPENLTVINYIVDLVILKYMFKKEKIFKYK